MNYIILTLLTLFVIKHFICDFYLQFDYMLREKGIYGATGGRDHSILHALGTTLVLFLVLNWNSSNQLIAITLGALDGIIHYHVDWLKVQLNEKLNYSFKDRQFWTLLGADQMLHYLTYIGIIAILST